MQESMLEPKSGRFYGAHQASAPGEAPAYETGILHDSFSVKGINQYAVGIFTSDPEVADMMENGTIWIEPRPFMAPAILEVAGRYPQIIRNAIRQATR